MSTWRLLSAGSFVALSLGLGSAAPAQDSNAGSIEAARALLANEAYVRPPDVIAKLVTAPRHLSVSLTQPSPDRKYFIKEQSNGLPTVSAFGKPHLYFGGLQVDPAANRSRTLTTRGAVALTFLDPSRLRLTGELKATISFTP